MQMLYRSRPKPGEAAEVVASYRCHDGSVGGPTPGCQTIKSAALDEIVREAFGRALEPARLDVSMEALQELDDSSRAAGRHWELQLEKARYDADRSKRQFDRVEPENRLVAADLERRWEERLKEAKRLDEEYARWKQGREATLTGPQFDELRKLVKDVRILWDAPSTTNEDRKELLRLLIEDVWVIAEREKRRLEVRILWKGGSQTVHEAPWHVAHPRTPGEVLRRIEELAGEGLFDREIAERLNAEGFRHQKGGPFSLFSVQQKRKQHGISKAPRPREEDVYSGAEAARKLGVSRAAVSKWIRSGLLKVEEGRPGGKCEIRLTEEDITRLGRSWDQNREWTVREAAKFMEMGPDEVYNLVRGKALQARRASVGLRRLWLIPAEEVRRWKERPE